MGTSSSYGGPGAGGTLLPPWAPPPPALPPTGATPPGTQPAQDVPQPVPSMSWGAAKGLLTRFGSSGGSRSGSGRKYLRSAVSGYVGAQGGSRAASRNAIGGRRSTQALGGFLGSLVANGPAAALRSVGLGDRVGSDAMTLLGALVDRLASRSHGLEDNVARSAMTKTLHALFEARGVADGGIEALKAVSVEDAKLVIQDYVARYIDERLLQVMGDGLQEFPMDELVLREHEIWDYIRNRVILDLRKVDVLKIDWASPEAAALVDKVFTDAHRVLV